MNFQTMHKQRVIILIAAVVGVIAVFLPWRTFSVGLFGAGISEGMNGFRGAGILVFFCYLAAGVLTLAGDQSAGLSKNSWLAALATALVSLICVVAHIISVKGGSIGFMEFGIGFGCWIALAASIVIGAAAWIKRGADQNLKDSFDALKKNLVTVNTAARPAGTSSPKTEVNKIEEIEKLIKLKEEGHISEIEYQQMKSKLL